MMIHPGTSIGLVVAFMFGMPVSHVRWTTTHMGDLDKVAGSWSWPDLVLVVADF